MNAEIHLAGGNARFGCALGLMSLLLAPAAWAWPDLAVVKSGPAQAAPGDLITYTLVYTNAGPNRSTQVVLKDFLPGYVTVLTNTLSGGSLAGGTISWSLGTVSSHTGGSRSFQVRADTNVLSNLSITNRAYISGSEAEETGKTNNNLSILITKIINSPPVARDDYYILTEDTTLVIAAPGILSNDSDPEGKSLTAVLASAPVHGSLMLNANGGFSYTPEAHYVGDDSFTYKANDGYTNSAPATVTLTVSPCYPSLDVMLVIDRTGSMGDPIAKYNDARQACSNFIDNLNFTHDQAGIVSYNTAATLDQKLTNNSQVLDQAIHSISAPVGYTIISAGIETAQTELASSRRNPQALPVLVLLSDGLPTREAPSNALHQATLAKNAGTRIFTVGLGADVDPVLMAGIASSPGDYFYTTNSTELTALFNAISTILCRPPTNIVVIGPSDLTLCPGETASFSVAASGCASFNYQWTKDGAPIAGQTNSSLAIPNVTATDAAVYAVEVKSVCQSVTNSAVLTVNTPVSATDLTSLTRTTGSSATFSTVASGTGPFSYTWKKNDSTMPGQTNNSLTLDNITRNDAGTYTVEVTGMCGSVTKSGTLTVVNSAPVALDDSYTTAEDTALNVSAPGVLGNDSDVDADPLTAIIVSQPSHGAVTLNGNGSFNYQPATNYHGSDSFTYKANDGQADSGIATVTLTVTGQNDPPVAVDDSYSTAEDTQLTISAPGVLANDSDVDADPLTAIIVSQPTHGSVILSGNGSLTYQPATNYHGSDSFTYKANDGQADSGVATVTLTVTGQNDPPAALDDGYTTAEDTVLNISAPGVLANDSDVDADPLTAIPVSPPSHGSVTFNADGSFSYAPTGDYFGSDAFTYRANDSAEDSEVATVNITVTPVNDAPSFTKGANQLVQQNAAAQTIPDWATDISPGPANETDQIVTFQVSNDNPTLFAAQPGISGSGTLTFTPAPNAHGVATITVIARDDGGTANGGVDTSAPQTFAITVNAPPTVVITSPTNGAVFIAPADFTILAHAQDLDGSVAKVEFLADTNLVGEAAAGVPDSYFIVLTNVPVGSYTFTAEATDNLGAKGTSAPVTVSVIERPPLSLVGSMRFNPQTGLFDHTVRVFNPTYSEFNAVRVYVLGLTNGATVFNPSGVTNGVPYVETHARVAPNSYIDLVIEYYVPTRIPPNPVLRAQLVSPHQGNGPLLGEVKRIERGVMLPNKDFLIEFSTLSNRVYYVQYCSELGVWKKAQPAITGNGTRIQWIDNGEPKTESAPAATPMRFYRVILLP